MVKGPLSQDSHAGDVPRGADRLGLEPLSTSAPTPSDEHGPDCYKRMREQTYTVYMETIDKLRVEAEHYLNLIRNTNPSHVFKLAELRYGYDCLYTDIERMLRVYRKEHNV